MEIFSGALSLHLHLLMLALPIYCLNKLAVYIAEARGV